MCGIAGLVCFDPACGVAHEPLVGGMCDLQVHRGPDDSGIVNIGPACLGSRRLSIIDLSPAGHMPMSDASERWWITYNGEVYNFEALREELVGLGHTFRSRTDTEVVLHSWIEWGDACVERFVGMFAFAVYDVREQALTLVRDRYGIKPLYHSVHGPHFLFASELKALAIPGDRVRVDRHSLMEWSLYRNVDALTPETMVEGISSVLPGHRLTVRDREVSGRELYSPTAAVSEDHFVRFARASKDELVEELEHAIERAVRLRLVSDVPVGTLLSGGLDSSLITALAARHREDLKAFNVAIEGFEELDENRYARELTDTLGLELVTLNLTGEAFRRELANAVYHSDAPLTHPNSVAYSLISRVAREHGVIVLLSGEGADELFGGYSFRYRRQRFLLRLRPFMKVVPERARRILELLTYSMAGMPATSWRFRDLLPPTVRLVDRYARSEWLHRCERAYDFVGNPRERQILGTILADLGDFLTPLLRRLDRMTMAASVECRVPYLDHEVVHRAIQLPMSYRVGWRSDKWVLKQVATGHVPRTIVKRKKLGFPLPLHEYMRPLMNPGLFESGFCERVLGLPTRSIREALRTRQETQEAFGLITLELWGRLHVLGEPLETVQKSIDRSMA